MTRIGVTVADQDLAITQKPLIASGDMGTVLLSAEFSEEWDGYAKTAVFYQSEKNVYHQVLDENDECIVPWEALKAKGTMYFGIYGIKDGIRKTSEVLAYKIVQGAWSEATAPSEPSEDIYAQIMSAYAETFQRAKESADKANEAALNTANIFAVVDKMTTCKNAEITLLQSNWNYKVNEVDVPEVSENDTVIVGASTMVQANYDRYVDYSIRCVGQSEGKLVFTCSAVPDGDVVVNVAIFTPSKNPGDNDDPTTYATTDYVDTAIKANGKGIKSIYTLTDSTSVSTGGIKNPEWQKTQFTFGDGSTWTYNVDATLTKAWQAADAKTVGEALSKIASAGGLNTTAANLLITILRNAVYSSDQSANITALESALAPGNNEEPDEPVVPDEPDVPGESVVTLTSISAAYSGGDVPVGTAVADLTGIVVTAMYSDGTSETVTGYTLSGEIAEGSNTVTVSYGGKTTTFTVTGVAESGGDSEELVNESNIVKVGHTINKNADYSFYQLDAKDGVNVYEIPVEAGVTYRAAVTGTNQYGVPYWSNNQITKVNASGDIAISAVKLTDFDTVGSRVNGITFDKNATIDLTNAGTKVNNGDGTYSNVFTFVPAISGYLYIDNRTTNQTYSIKKVVA